MKLRCLESEVLTSKCRSKAFRGCKPIATLFARWAADAIGFRTSGFFRFSVLDIRFLIVPVTFISAFNLLAATNELALPDEIPPLRPPKAEILPGFWEQHGVAVCVATLVGLIGLALLWKVLSRPKPPVIPAPAATARLSLEPFREHKEDGMLLAQVSSILRRYFITAFVLPEEELTNHELCRRLEDHPKVGPELASAATNLLQTMDHRRFNTEAEQPQRSTGIPPFPQIKGQKVPPLATEDTDDGGQAGRQSYVVEEALLLIDLAEKQLHPPPVEIEPVRSKS